MFAIAHRGMGNVEWGQVVKACQRRSHHEFTDLYKRTTMVWGKTYRETVGIRDLKHATSLQLGCQYPVEALNRYYSIYQAEKLPAPFYQTSALTGWLLQCGHLVYRLFHIHSHNFVTGKTDLAEVIVDNGRVDDPEVVTHATIRQRVQLAERLEGGRRTPIPFIEEVFFRNKKGDFELIENRQNVYNINGKLVHRRIYQGQHIVREVSWDYNLQDRVMQHCSSRGILRIKLDEQGRPIEEYEVISGITRSKSYDQLGRLVCLSEVDLARRKRVWHYKHGIDMQDSKIVGHTILETNPEGRQTLRRIDMLGREWYTQLPSIVKPSGKLLNRFVHRIYGSDQLKEMQKLKYNNASNHHEVILYQDEGTIHAVGPVMIREFDLLGRMQKATPILDKSKVVYFDYEGFCLTAERHQNGDEWRFFYDTLGSLVKETFNGKNRFEYSYDGIQRMTKKKEFRPGGVVQETDYTYEGPGTNLRPYFRSACVQGEEEAASQKVVKVKKHYDGWKRLVKVESSHQNTALIPLPMVSAHQKQ